MLYLKEANFEDIEKEYLFVRDVPYDENGFINECCGISRDAFDNALTEIIGNAKGLYLPDGYVPQTIYFLWNDSEIVGQFNFRHYLCDSLRTGSGHIGYYIKNEFRGRGYAKEGLRLLLPIARKTVPDDEIYLRVNKDNLASLKVMLSNGGYIEHEDEDNFYVRISK